MDQCLRRAPSSDAEALHVLNLATALRQSIRLLTEAKINSPALTAEVLLLHAIHAERTTLRAHPERELTDLQQLHYGRYLHERLQGNPTQYITGHREFWGLGLAVNPAVLIPRPETEHVVERALQLARDIKARSILDCGTGSGAIALALASELSRPTDVPPSRLTDEVALANQITEVTLTSPVDARPAIFAADISTEALSVAAGNARRLQLPICLVAADLATAFADSTLDLYVSNPPYVALADRDSLAPEVRDHEPALALFAGEDGTSVYRRLIPDAARALRQGGWLVLELGYNVASAVRDLLAPNDWDSVASDLDLAGIERVMYARRQ